MAACEPGEIICRLELALIIGGIPDVDTEAGVIGEVQLQRIIAHPGHLANKIADPCLRVILTAAIQRNCTLLGIGDILGSETLDRSTGNRKQMLEEGIGAVEHTLNGICGDDGFAGDVQFEALCAKGGIGDGVQADIACFCPFQRTPDNRNTITYRVILVLDQLGKFHKFRTRLGLGNDVDPAVEGQSEYLIIRGKLIPQHTQCGGTLHFFRGYAGSAESCEQEADQ